MNKCMTFIVVMFFFNTISIAQQPKDLAFDVKTSYINSPFKIVLKIKLATNMAIYRKYPWETTRNKPVAYLLPTDSIFIDSNVVEGMGYEYEIMGGAKPVKYAYIYAGKNLPAVHYRGKLILLVDDTYIPSLNPDIDLLITDLIGDGWQVIRHNISRSMSVSSVKSIILNDYNADTINVKSLFILGHIAVPYSGEIAPDGHTEHTGAWPADGYYSDMNGAYTDISVNYSSAKRIENRNVPGDGKFDQVLFSGVLALQSGRVDLYNMPAFSSNDAILIKRYLNKNHSYKFKKINPRRQALIQDNFGYFSGESFATSGWRAAFALVGSDSTIGGNYFADMKNQSYILSYGCGPGSYTSCSGIGSTSNFVSDSLKNVFTMLFGSYFGDWDNQNNFLRAPLASKSWTLTSCWSGRGYWMLSHFGMGLPIGFSARQNQNDAYMYSPASYKKYVNIALMGDPTLRMHIVAPPDSLKMIAINYGSSIQLNWKASSDSVLGYYVYRADSLFGAFSLLTTEYVSSTNFIDQFPPIGNKTYMVRAVKLEKAYTGSYYNLSQGIMDTITVDYSVSVDDIKNSDFKFQIYPNPANQQTVISYQLFAKSKVNIKVYDLIGKEVKQLSMNNEQLTNNNTGKHTISVDVGDLKSGIYFVKFETESGTRVGKLVVSR